MSFELFAPKKNLTVTIDAAGRFNFPSDLMEKLGIKQNEGGKNDCL